jgi:large subunit ribosomal protein L4
VDNIELPDPKTRLFAETVSALGLASDKALFVTPIRDESLIRSSRNIYKVLVLPTEGLNVYDLLKFDRLVLLRSSIPKIVERLS